MPETVLTGTLVRIKYASDNSAWSVAELQRDGAVGKTPIVGELFQAAPGERLRLVGSWVTDAKFGRQFRFQSYTSLVPATVDGIRKYLSSGLVDGIGDELARRLVDHFGAETLSVIEGDPGRLREVDGIGAKRAERIRAAYDKGRTVRDIMVFLHSNGVSTHFAGKIFEHYGEQAIRVVRSEPYRLARDIRGIGFLSADRIAREVGIAPDAPARAEAGLLHSLDSATSEGHVFVPATALVERTAELLEVDSELVERAVVALRQRRALAIETLPDGERAVFPLRLYHAERLVAEQLRARLAPPPRGLTSDEARRLARVEQGLGVALSRGQREAMRMAIVSPVLVVTGGPGTGKTTIVRGILSLLRGTERRVSLAAPTGRASRRLQEAAVHPAQTIHRLLEFSPKAGGFQRSDEQPLDCDAIIVDEASMLDIGLFHALLSAVPASAQLVLVGDADQLPSVGPGSVLGDLIASGCVPTVRLTEIFRQSQESAIVRNAHRILSGEDLEPPAPGAKSDFYFIEKEAPEDVLAIVRRLLGERIPEGFGFDPILDVQVLAPMYRGILGTDHLNEQLQALLNPEGRKVSFSGGRFRVGDRVMQIRNDYDKDVFNGDVGLVRRFDPEAKTMVVAFDGRLVEYTSADLHELVLAYAVSVHKSQGSEYPAVVLPVHTQHYVMLQRNLLYTGVTRGKKLVVLVGNRRGLQRAIRNDQMTRRWTRLAERLAGPLEESDRA